MVLLIVLFAASAYAADGEAYTFECQDGNGTCLYTITWTAAADGSKADYTLVTAETDRLYKGYYLYSARTIPGSTAPAADYDITVNDTDERMDLMSGNLADRSATATEKASASTTAEPIMSGIYVTWSNVTNANATGTLLLYFARY